MHSEHTFFVLAPLAPRQSFVSVLVLSQLVRLCSSFRQRLPSRFCRNRGNHLYISYLPHRFRRTKSRIRRESSLASLSLPRRPLERSCSNGSQQKSHRRVKSKRRCKLRSVDAGAVTGRVVIYSARFSLHRRTRQLACDPVQFNSSFIQLQSRRTAQIQRTRSAHATTAPCTLHSYTIPHAHLSTSPLVAYHSC